MVHKFCRNHLTELYEALRVGDIVEIEKIEHQLSPAEECVACAYAFRAKGTAREVLLAYLQSEGFAVSGKEKSGVLVSLRFWGIRLSLLLIIFLPVFAILQKFIPAIFSLIFASLASISVFVLIDQFFD